MKNIPSTYLVALLGFSLAGIIGLQVYLFNNSITVKEAQFNRDAMGAMQSISKRLEVLDAMRFIDNEMDFKPWLSRQIGDDLIVDSLNDNKILTSNGNMVMSKDTFILLGDGQTKARMQVSRGSNQFGQSEQVHISIGSNPNRVYQRMGKMDSVFHTMVTMGMKSAIPIAQRFSMDDIDSVIKSELRQYDINANYEYAVIENGYLTSLQSEEFNPADADFRIPVFRNDYFAGPKWLMLSFPNKDKYVLSSMWLMFLLSLLFTLAIVLTFWKTLQQMQKQKRISQIKTDFINNMTHEFKTPIATINLAVDAMNNPKVAGNREKLGHYSNVIRKENKRMHAQVENVLKLAMLDKKELELNREVCSINELAISAIEHIRLAVESRNGSIIDKLDENISDIDVDPVHIENVLVNILDNANKYSKDSPKISVKTFENEGFVFVEIKDQGRGMSQEVRKQVFERFYREETGNIHNVKGHGLGLSYAIKMIRMHGGDIEVESIQGNGSTFIVKLPIYESIN